jgi:hypothetical protein
MPSYEWQTEEDATRVGQEPEGQTWLPKPWLKVGFIVLLLLVSGGLIYRQLEGLANSRVAEVEQDVLAAFELWREAAATGDTELLEVLLDAGRPAWSEAQRRLAQSGLLLGRPQLGLSLLASSGPDLPSPSVRLGPDLQEGLVTFELPYTLQEAPGGEPVYLQHTVALRRQGPRWVLTQPDEEYWGRWRSDSLELLEITYRERDADLARRLGRDLAADLSAVCERLPGGDCRPGQKISLRLENDPALVPLLIQRYSPFFEGDTAVLPTPGLLGWPADDAGYDLLYTLYAARLFPILSSGPAAAPEQDIAILCYPPDGYAPRLYRYNPRLESWTAEIPANRYRQMWPVAGGEGLVLHDYRSGSEASRLNLTFWHQGRATPILDETFIRLLPYPFDWNGQTAGPNLLFQHLDPILSSPRRDDGALVRLDLSRCQAGACDLTELGGFPLWSPDRRYTLLVRNRLLYLGDAQGRQQRALGPGFSPFWLDQHRYGFARYVVEEGQLQVEIVLARIDRDEPHRLLTTAALLPLLTEEEEGQLFANFVAVQPGTGRHLVLAANRYATSGDRFFLFAAELAERAGDDLPALGPPSLRLQLPRSPSGFSSLVTPDGSIPFSFSPGGRWLSLGLLADRQSNHWSIYVHDLENDQTEVLSANHPVYTARRPYTDWSADGQWLLIVDDGFLQLVAPASSDRRLVNHELASCRNAAWIHPDS